MKEFIHLKDISTNTDLYTNLRHFFLTIFPGEIHYLVGLHGSGKTALRKVLCGQLPIQSGTMSINGNVISSYSAYRARLENIVAIEHNVSPLIPSLSIYENMEIFHSVIKAKRKTKLFERKNSLKRIHTLIEEYNLSIDPMKKIRDIANEDVFLLYLLEAAYVDAKLIIINLSQLKLSFINSQRFFRILKQMNAQGAALLLLCDSFFPPLLPGKVNIIDKGYIIKQYDSATTDAAYINSLLLPADISVFHQNATGFPCHIIGIIELCYNNYSLPEYLFNLGLVSNDMNNNDSNTSIKFLKADSLNCFCDNLSVGDNIALVRYPSIAENTGYIDPSILNYLEKEFYNTLSQFISNPSHKTEDLSSAAKKILGIERWIMAGMQKLVIEDPLFGLDAEGQQILLRYFTSLRDRNIQLIFIFYNLSELQKICDTVHICNHGRICDSVLNNFPVDLDEELILSELKL